MAASEAAISPTTTVSAEVFGSAPFARCIAECTPHQLSDLKACSEKSKLPTKAFKSTEYSQGRLRIAVWIWPAGGGIRRTAAGMRTVCPAG